MDAELGCMVTASGLRKYRLNLGDSLRHIGAYWFQWRQTVMRDWEPALLRQQADRFRRRASLLDDDEAEEAARELAEDYEAEAANVEEGWSR
jgi:hypothetical protein